MPISSFSSEKMVLVVGGAGFIGSHVNTMLQRAGCSTVVLDNLQRGDRRTVLSGDFVEGDMGKIKDLTALFQTYPIDAVLHFGAWSDVGESVRNPSLYYENNVGNTLHLLACMRAFGVRYLVFSSSAAVYGLPQEERITESHPCLPINPYGRSKHMVEMVLEDYAAAYDLRYVSLRYFNAAGGDPEEKIPYAQKKPTNLIPLVLSSLAKGEKRVTVFGTDYPTPDGTCIRDYIHIEDLGTAHCMALSHLLQGGKSACYNLGNGRGFSVREVLDAIRKETGLSPKIHEGDRRPGDPPVLVANARKIRNDWGWQPQYPDLATMVTHAWQAIRRQ